MSTAFTQPERDVGRPPNEGRAAAVADLVIDTVKRAAANAPRSKQAFIGPSEVGSPCPRRLAYKLLDWPATNTDNDPWAATVGTAVHAWMADTYTAENARLGRDRYLVEHRLTIAPPLLPGGSCDLYDRDTATGIDWKVTSPDNLKKYRAAGHPGTQYETQAHLYGLGLVNAGETPSYVCVVFLPRGGRIDNLYVWVDDYDPAKAAAALARLDGIKNLIYATDPETNPDMWGIFPTADAHCLWCPWFKAGSTDLSTACPSHLKASTR